MLAAIPYETFPDLPLGLNTFGLMVALGVLLGAKLGADYGERFGVNREDTYRTGTWMVVAGVVGSRITWVITHHNEVTSPFDDPVESFVDAIAVWRGGLQFAGGFIAGLAVGLPMMIRWTRVQRWNVLNGYALGLTAGVAIGRIGCYAVGEHFGRQTSFFLGTRYDGPPETRVNMPRLDAFGNPLPWDGDVREPTLGPDGPSIVDLTFHNTSLYELIQLVLLFGLMVFLILRARRRAAEVAPAALVGLFFVWYGVVRFLTDTLRVNDDRVLQMTGAQWMSLVMVPYGLYVLWKVRPDLIKLQVGEVTAAPAAGLLGEADDPEPDDVPVPDELEAPDEAAAARASTAADDADDEDTAVAEGEAATVESADEPVPDEAAQGKAADDADDSTGVDDLEDDATTAG